jgi:hypothetical protein
MEAREREKRRRREEKEAADMALLLSGERGEVMVPRTGVCGEEEVRKVMKFLFGGEEEGGVGEKGEGGGERKEEEGKKFAEGEESEAKGGGEQRESGGEKEGKEGGEMAEEAAVGVTVSEWKEGEGITGRIIINTAGEEGSVLLENNGMMNGVLSQGGGEEEEGVLRDDNMQAEIKADKRKKEDSVSVMYEGRKRRRLEMEGEWEVGEKEHEDFVFVDEVSKDNDISKEKVNRQENGNMSCWNGLFLSTSQFPDTHLFD